MSIRVHVLKRSLWLVWVVNESDLQHSNLNVTRESQEAERAISGAVKRNIYKYQYQYLRLARH